jgi:hypothetical protein
MAGSGSHGHRSQINSSHLFLEPYKPSSNPLPSPPRFSANPVGSGDACAYYGISAQISRRPRTSPLDRRTCGASRHQHHVLDCGVGTTAPTLPVFLTCRYVSALPSVSTSLLYALQSRHFYMEQIRNAGRGRARRCSNSLLTLMI